MKSIDLETAKRNAGIHLIATGKSPDRVAEYLDDPFGFAVTEPLSGRDSPENIVVQDFDSWLHWQETRKDK